MSTPTLFLVLGSVAFAWSYYPKRWIWWWWIASIGIPLGPAIAWKTPILSSYAFFKLISAINPMWIPQSIGRCSIFFLSLSFFSRFFPFEKDPPMKALLSWGSVSHWFIMLFSKPRRMRMLVIMHLQQFILNQSEQNPGGIIDVPYRSSEKTYVQQIFHGQPILGGPGQNRVQPLNKRYQR